MPMYIAIPDSPNSPVQLEINALRDLALDDIRSKITSENVAAELFSRFASRWVFILQSEIITKITCRPEGNRDNDVMKMHCELLGGEFTEESTTASVEDVIKGMVGGRAVHRASALKLALRNYRLAISLPSSPIIMEVVPVCDYFYDDDLYA